MTLTYEKLVDELITSYDYRLNYCDKADEKDYWNGVIHGLKMALEKENLE